MSQVAVLIAPGKPLLSLQEVSSTQPKNVVTSRSRRPIWLSWSGTTASYVRSCYPRTKSNFIHPDHSKGAHPKPVKPANATMRAIQGLIPLPLPFTKKSLREQTDLWIWETSLARDELRSVYKVFYNWPSGAMNKKHNVLNPKNERGAD